MSCTKTYTATTQHKKEKKTTIRTCIDRNTCEIIYQRKVNLPLFLVLSVIFRSGTIYIWYTMKVYLFIYCTLYTYISI